MTKNLMHDLTVIRNLSGPFVITDNAKEWYKTWYVDVAHPERAEASMAGYAGRKHITLLKLAMILSATRRGSELKIHEAELDDALKMLDITERHLPEMMQTLQIEGSGAATMRVRRIIDRAGVIKHTELLRKTQHFANAKELQEIIRTLRESGDIIQVDTKTGGRGYKIR